MSDNPSAFPHPAYLNQFGQIEEAPASPGMTMRDYIASKAMAGLCADSNVTDPPHVIARAAYDIADAMLAARSAKP